MQPFQFTSISQTFYYIWVTDGDRLLTSHLTIRRCSCSIKYHKPRNTARTWLTATGSGLPGPSSSDWLGAWWMGMLVQVGACVLPIALMLMFPRRLPGVSRTMMEQRKRQEAIERGNKGEYRNYFIFVLV